jgi:LysR family transcriptional regulator, transcriptional activator of nhaA
MQNLKDINWNHLYCFYEVAKAQSLKKGALVLGAASSTISEQIRKLEIKFDKKLFKRSSKGLTLTQEGQNLYERSKAIFEEGNKLLEEFSDDSVGGYPVQIGIDETISYDVANEFASQYWDYYTMYGTVNTVRQADHDQLISNLEQGNVDWGISIQKPKRRSLDYAEIGSFEVVFCCSSELFNKFIDPVDLLNNIPFGEINWDKTLNKFVYKYLRKNGVVPKEKILSDHPGFLRKLCMRGRCISCIAKNPLAEYPDLKTFSLGTPLNITLYAIWKKSDEALISVIKLKDLIQSKLSHLPHRYDDVDLQIEVSDVSDEMLK